MNLDTIIGIAIATAAATILRWGASRWPSASEKRLRDRQARLDELTDRLEIRRLEKELGEDDA